MNKGKRCKAAWDDCVLEMVEHFETRKKNSISKIQTLLMFNEKLKTIFGAKTSDHQMFCRDFTPLGWMEQINSLSLQLNQTYKHLELPTVEAVLKVLAENILFL